MRFLFKTVIVCSEEKKGFDYMNNHKRNKSANFRLDNINKINYRIPIVILYILSRLRLRKV